MDISITQYYHRHEFKINFYRSSMIGAAVFRVGNVLIMYLWCRRVSRSSNVPAIVGEIPIDFSFSFLSCELIPFFSTFIPYFQISNQSFSSIGNFTVYIEILYCWRNKMSPKGDDEAYSIVLLFFSFFPESNFSPVIVYLPIKIMG